MLQTEKVLCFSKSEENVCVYAPGTSVVQSFQMVILQLKTNLPFQFEDIHAESTGSIIQYQIQ